MSTIDPEEEEQEAPQENQESEPVIPDKTAEEKLQELIAQEKEEQRRIDDQVVQDAKLHNKNTNIRFKDPRKMMSKYYKRRIAVGQSIFEHDCGEESRKGYLKMLSKINKSNLVLQQIKNGCSTIFDKDFMKMHYTNPHLSNGKLIEAMDEYMEVTKPQRFKDDIEKSIQNQSTWQVRSSINDFDSTINTINNPYTINTNQYHTTQSSQVHSPVRGAIKEMNYSSQSMSPAARSFDAGSRQENIIVLPSVISSRALENQNINTITTRNNQRAVVNSRLQQIHDPLDYNITQSQLDFSRNHLTARLSKTTILTTQILLDELSADRSEFSNRFGGETSASSLFQQLPHPFQTIERKQARKAEKLLKYPISPAFTVPTVKFRKEPNVKKVIDYCSQKNIPFKLEEDLYYKINQMKQMHQNFEKNVNKCFETKRPSHNEQGIKLLSNFEDEVIIKNNQYITLNKDGSPMKSVNARTLNEDGKVYMPQLAKSIMDNLKKQEEARMAKQQKELRKQENEVKEIIKKKARFDITRKSTFKDQYKSVDNQANNAKQLKGGGRISLDSVVGANFDGMLQKSGYFTTATNSMQKRMIQKNLIKQMHVNQLSRTQKDRLDTVGIMNRIFEKKKGTVLQSIDENMLSPFVPDKAQKRSSKRINHKSKSISVNPLSKIIKANQNHVKHQGIENKKLLRILERIELDQPILIHDKLEIILENEEKHTPNNSRGNEEGGETQQLEQQDADQQLKSNQCTTKELQEKKQKNPNNSNTVRLQLGRKKVERQNGNLKQINAYNQMLEHIDQRTEKGFGRNYERKNKTHIHEKEREFFDAIRLIIQNGYCLKPHDISDILKFININELQYFDTKEQDQVVNFLKDSICLLFAGEYGEDELQKIVEEYAEQIQTPPNEFLNDVTWLNNPSQELPVDPIAIQDSGSKILKDDSEERWN